MSPFLFWPAEVSAFKSACSSSPPSLRRQLFLFWRCLTNCQKACWTWKSWSSGHTNTRRGSDVWQLSDGVFSKGLREIINVYKVSPKWPKRWGWTSTPFKEVPWCCCRCHRDVNNNIIVALPHIWFHFSGCWPVALCGRGTMRPLSHPSFPVLLCHARARAHGRVSPPCEWVTGKADRGQIWLTWHFVESWGEGWAFRRRGGGMSAV